MALPVWLERQEVMDWHLLRTELQPTCTIGVLSIDGAFECFTLEDRVREGPKIAGETAIPAGRYAVKMRWSNRFAMALPHLQDVPGFASILIHAGNTDKDTAGCVLVGQQHEGDHLLRSRAALEALLQKIDVDAMQELWLTIREAETRTV
jgi:hypothetical protein